MVCQSNVTALLGAPALFTPGYECNSLLIVAPSDLTALYRDTALYRHTASSGDPYCIVN